MTGTQPLTPLSARDLCSRAPAQYRAPLVTRIFQVDARYRIQLSGAFGLVAPVGIDAWRTKAAMDVLFARGIWPLLTYYDITLSDGAVAPGHTSDATIGMVLGRTAERALVLATDMNIYAYQGSGVRETMRDKQSETPFVAANFCALAGLIQPFKPEEFVLRSVPDELTHLDVYDCQASPSLSDLSELEADFERAGAPLEHAFMWGMHQSDAMQVIYSAGYALLAEDNLARVIYGAGLPLAKYRSARVRIVYKRPFLAGQECVMRTSLFVRKSDNAATGLIAFHPVDAPSKVQDTPAVLVRLDGAFAS